MKNIYSIKDIKTGTYGNLIVVPHLAVIQRDISTVLQDPNSNLSMYPADYELFQLGTYDEETGHILATGTNIPIMSILDIKTSMDPKPIPMSQDVTSKKRGKNGA